jgi:hypothetical protein
MDNRFEVLQSFFEGGAVGGWLIWFGHRVHHAEWDTGWSTVKLYRAGEKGFVVGVRRDWAIGSW